MFIILMFEDCMLQSQRSAVLRKNAVSAKTQYLHCLYFWTCFNVFFNYLKPFCKIHPRKCIIKIEKRSICKKNPVFLRKNAVSAAMLIIHMDFRLITHPEGINLSKLMCIMIQINSTYTFSKKLMKIISSSYWNLTISKRSIYSSLHNSACFPQDKRSICRNVIFIQLSL